MTSLSQRIIFYIDDFERNIESFRTTCKDRWQSEFSVLSNVTYGRVDESNFDDFVEETLSEMNKVSDRIECVLLDLDYSGEDLEKADGKSKDTRVGFQLGKHIRKNWPLLPIFICSRFSDTHVKSKGLMHDFDHIDKPVNYIKMSEAKFEGILGQALSKRKEIVSNLPDIPTAFLTDTHRYFKKNRVIEVEENEVFIAMPFDTYIVSENVKRTLFDSVEQVGLKPYRVDEDIFSESIMDRIASHILESKYFIADITGMNPNVMFELGMAMASNKQCITIMDKNKNNDIPFDLRGVPVVMYEEDEIFKLKDDLLKRLESLIRQN